jgi:Putative peptidoglycan binding domain
MERKKQMLMAALLSASVGMGTQTLLAQGTPGGGSGAGPNNPVPRETQPTIPGQPAPGIPQTSPMPGQPGTIPERAERPKAGDQNMAVTSDDIKKAQTALKAKGLNPGTDGKMDSKTQQALRDFQKSNNLPVTGVLDEKTAEKLGVSKHSDVRSIPERGSSSKPDSSLPRSDKSNSLPK